MTTAILVLELVQTAFVVTVCVGLGVVGYRAHRVMRPGERA